MHHCGLEEYLSGLVAAARRAEQRDGCSEATMLLRPLQLFCFSVNLDLEKGVYIPPCAACFSRLLLHNTAAFRQRHSV